LTPDPGPYDLLSVDTAQLEGWLHFKDEDLTDNRDARLSPRQKRRMVWSGIWRLVIGPPLAVLPMVFALQIDIGVVIVLMLLLTALGLFFTWLGFAFLVDALEGSVAFLTGPLKGKRVQTKNGYTYWATIGPVSKQINARVFQVLPTGVSCHLYYAPACRSLLSVEPASETEPKPAHPFGPDSAHVWDRLRSSWVVITVGVLAIPIGAHVVAGAHPARAIAVEARISNYVEVHGKSTSRTFYLADGSTYTPQREDYYSPPAPVFSTLIGRQVTLYVNAGTSDVIGIYDGEQTYGADWYLHPEHQTTNEVLNGVAVIALGALSLLVGVGMIAYNRRRSTAEAPALADFGPPPSRLYAPPSVRPVSQLWPAAALFTAVALTLLLVLGLAARH
jgi:hypothetical protein